MEFNVAGLLKESIGSTRQYTIDEQVQLPDSEVSTWVHGGVCLLRTDQAVLVLCSFETKVDCLCSRCLTRYQEPVQITMEEEYLPTVDMSTGTRLPIPDQDTFTLDEHHVLNLEEALRQYLLVNLPMRPLCQEDCLGICASCGTNLNQGICACEQHPVDLRWTPLLNLKGSLE